MSNAIYFALGFILLISCLMISKLLRRRADRQGTFDRPSVPTRARDELEQLIVQMQEVAREQIAKADGKIRMLNQLLLECEQRKKELEELLGKSKEVPCPPAPVRPANPLHERVFSLQDQGKSTVDICQETGLELGEVEMILGLRKLHQP